MLTPALVASALLIPIVGTLRQAFAIQSRYVPLVLLVLGPALMLAGWALRFLPAGTTPQDAVRYGFLAAPLAAGAFSKTKAVMGK